MTFTGTAQTGTAQTCTLAYDQNGNLATKTCALATTSYAWDAQDRLTGIQGPGVTASFQYDALGRRISRMVNGQTTAYLYDGVQAIAETRNGQSTALLSGLDIDEMIARYTGASQRTYLTDALGSVIAQAREDQSIQNWYGYSPYGQTTATADDEGNSSEYTARENDGTGMYYYRARYYDPVLKRFVSEDPIGVEGGINAYAYVGGDPVSFVDPMGLCQQAVWRGGYIVGWVPCGAPNAPPTSFPTASSPNAPLMCPVPPDDPPPPPLPPWLTDPTQQAIQSKCPECWLIGLRGTGVAGSLFGRARYRGGQAGVLNGGDFRVGWSWNQNGWAGARNYFGAHGGKPGTPTHWHQTPVPGPKRP